MKQGQKGIAWIVEHHKPTSFVCEADDSKGALASMICEAMAKGQRIFRYHGRNLPRQAIKDIGAKYPGLLIASYTSDPPNADIAYADTEDGRKKIWHNSVVLYFGETAPPNSATACRYLTSLPCG